MAQMNSSVNLFSLLYVDYADDVVLLANTLAHSEFLLYNLEQTAEGINLHVNANKTEFMCFKQEGVTSTSSLFGCPIHMAFCHI